MKAKEFEKKFDDGEDVSEHLDYSKAKRAGHDAKRVNVDFPLWMIESLDREADRLGVTRQSVIKMWLADRLKQVERNSTYPEELVTIADVLRDLATEYKISPKD